MKTCSNCEQERDAEHFRKGTTLCIFCEINAAYAHADKLLHFLNSHPPLGEQMQQSCFGCKTLNWWVNLTMRGPHKYCKSCLDRKANEEKALIERGEQQQKIQDDLVNSLFA